MRFAALRQHLAVLLCSATVLCAAPPAAAQATFEKTQSDGSVEAIYARECPRQQDTQVCNALRAVLPQASASVSRAFNFAGKTVLEVNGDIRKEGKTAGLMGERYVQKSLQLRAGKVYRVRLETTDRVVVTLCKDPALTSFDCWGRLDTWTVNSWDVVGSDLMYLTVRGAGSKGVFRLSVEEAPITTAWDVDWTAKRAILNALPGQIFRANGGTDVMVWTTSTQPGSLMCRR